MKRVSQRVSIVALPLLAACAIALAAVVAGTLHPVQAGVQTIGGVELPGDGSIRVGPPAGSSDAVLQRVSAGVIEAVDGSGNLGTLRGQKTLGNWGAADLIPGTGGAGPTLSSRGTDHQTLLFDDGAQESAYAELVMPFEYSGGNLVIDIWWSAVNTGGDAVWDVAFQEINPDSEDLDAVAFATPIEITVAAAGTSGLVSQESITFTNAEADSITADTMLRIRIRRLGSDPSDDLVGDAELVRFSLREE